MKVFTVSPQENKSGIVSAFTVQQGSLKFNNKKDALSYVKRLQRDFKVISFNVDFYKNGDCLKNEFGVYENGSYRNIETIVYSKRQAAKLEYKISDFFNV